jgi:D-glycero-alpha-D-manno-heptose 1-phosphate guanylyltransferase
VTDGSMPLAVILAGGLGSRLRRVLPDLPKALAPVAGRPFLEWILRFLRLQGVERVVLSTGHLGDHVEQFARRLRLDDLEIYCVREPAPLGTAGALLYALAKRARVEGDVLVCNGDSLALGSLSPLVRTLHEPATAAAVLGVPVADAAHYGTLDTGANGVLQGFSEKRSGTGMVNAGVYVLRRATFDRFPTATPLSLEHDVFPSLVREGVRIKVVPCECPFLDIGRESTLPLADSFVEKHMEWFR